MTDINELTDLYYEARRLYDEITAEQKTRSRIMRTREMAMVDAMLELGWTSINRTDGTKPTLAAHFDISLTKDNEQQARAWLMETEGDDAPFLKEKLDKTAVRALLKEKGEDDVPDFFNVKTRPVLRVTGWDTRL